MVVLGHARDCSKNTFYDNEINIVAIETDIVIATDIVVIATDIVVIATDIVVIATDTVVIATDRSHSNRPVSRSSILRRLYIESPANTSFTRTSSPLASLM